MKKNSEKLRVNSTKMKSIFNVGAGCHPCPENNKGITLIALIITILVMLILVGVTVSILINSNMIGIAQNTADKTKTEYEKESNISEIKVGDKTYGSINEYTDTVTPMPEIKAGERATRTSKYVDGARTAIIPKGFTVSAIKNDTVDETTIDEGLVIYDIPAADLADSTKVDWSKPDTVKTKYNQFVWIPVVVNKTTEPKDTETSIASFRRSVWQDNARVENNVTSSSSFPSGNWSKYIEPYAYDGSDYDGANGTGIAAQIAELTKSIYNYEGFYIGRYEAGVTGTTPRTSSSSQTAPFVIQQDKYPYNYIKWGTNMSTVNTEGAVYLSNNLYAKTNTNYGATSMLCTGACWDAMLDFVKDSSHNVTSSATWGNYYESETYKVYRGSLYSSSKWAQANTADGSDVTKDTIILLTTGATDRNSSKNIYDVAGNCIEWTTEAYDTFGRVLRNGYYDNYGSYYPASYRLVNHPDINSYSYYSFRPTLYVK